MRITQKTGWITAAAVSMILLFSCASVDKPVPAGKSGYNRVQFGTELNRLVTNMKYDEAIALFDTVPEPDASDLSILRLKLAILTAAGRLDEAVELADSLEAGNPNDTELPLRGNPQVRQLHQVVLQL